MVKVPVLMVLKRMVSVSGGKIIWNAPSGANLSGSVWLCAGDNAVDASYASPIVYINGSLGAPAEQNSKTAAGVGYGFHIYEFKNSGPVTKVEIAPDPTTLLATIMSIGVGNSWLIDAGIDISGVNTGVVPDDIVGGNTVLTFPDTQGFDCFEPGDVVQGPNVQQGDTYTAAWGDSTTASYADATFLETIEIGSRPTVSISKRYYFYDFGKPVANVEWVRYAGPLNNNSDRITLSISDDGSNWTDLITTGNINSPTTDAHPPFASTIPARYYKISRPDSIMDSANYGFDDNVLNEQVKIISKDEDANTITVDGGEWKGSDGTGDQADGDNKLTKETPYDTKLTVDSDKDLADMTGATFMSDGSGAPGPYTQTPYKLVTSEITNVDDSDSAAIELTFADPNPDLRYFKPGDVVQDGVSSITDNWFSDMMTQMAELMVVSRYIQRF